MSDDTEFSINWSKENDMAFLKKYRWYLLAVPAVAAILGYILDAINVVNFPGVAGD